jgi:hypothetical protein
LAVQQSKLTEKLENSALNIFLVVNEPEEQEFSLKKSKFHQIMGSGWRLHRIFSNLKKKLAGQQSKLTEKLENSAINMFPRTQNQLKFGFFKENSCSSGSFTTRHMFRAEFTSFSVSFDCWSAKKSGNNSMQAPTRSQNLLEF